MNSNDMEAATILVVDDNPINLNVLSDCLTDEGFTVLLKKSGEKALELISRKPPDIILLDIIMPGMDGFETCRQLKQDQDTRDIPVIFMTALSDTTDKLRGFKLGAVDYITKPFHQEEVLARVKAHLTIQNLKTDLKEKNRRLKEALEREKRLVEDLRLNLSLSLPHELRTPLNGILGFSRYLIDPDTLPESKRIVEFGKHIHESGLRLHRLVENSLLYANLKLLRYAPGDRSFLQSDECVEAKDMITSIVRKSAKSNNREQDLQLDLIDTGVQASRKNFEKIILELIENAFKFSEPGTPVLVKSTMNANLHVLSITDKGRGMSKEQIANIGAYMQFDRDRHEQQGSGLGLTISYLLALLEGGMLSVDSQVEVGTTVSVVLSCGMEPAARENTESHFWFREKKKGNSEPSETIEDESPNITGYRSMRMLDDESSSGMGLVYRILVISAKKKNRTRIRELLAPLGFEVEEAYNWQEGLAMAGEWKPQLVITEALIIDAGDFDLIHSIRQTPALNYVRVMAVIAPGITDEERKQLAMLYDEIIPAPLRTEELLNKLSACLGLEWICSGEQPDESFIVPPREELVTLARLTAHGQVKNISARLDAIDDLDPKYKPFTDKIRTYADSFQIKMIRNLIDKRLEQES